MSRLVFSRFGNKEKDLKFFKEFLPLDDINTVVEPFGGTFAVIRKIYNDKKIKKIVNDNDNEIYEIYKNPEEYLEYYKKMCAHAFTFENENKNIRTKELLIDIEGKEEFKSRFKDYFIRSSIVRGNLFRARKDNDCSQMLEIMKDIEFYNEDYKNIIEKYKDKKEAFIFLDPPYLFSNNNNYSAQRDKTGMDMTHIIIYLLELFKDKKTLCKLMLIINKLNIIEYLFKDYIKGEYNKQYGISKKRDVHLIITNF